MPGSVYQLTRLENQRPAQAEVESLSSEPPQRSHRTSCIPGKSLGHTGKAWGYNSCRQIGLMRTGMAEQFFLSLGKQEMFDFTKIKRFVVGGRWVAHSQGKGEPQPLQRVC